MWLRIRERLASCITRQWYVVVLLWLALAVILRLFSPAWDAVVQDGDFQFLPANSPSRIGHETLRRTFPDDLSRSQMVIVFANPTAEVSLMDQCTMLDVARRLTAKVSEINLQRWLNSKAPIDADSAAVQRLRHTLDAAVSFDEQWFERVRELAGEDASIASLRLVDAYRHRRLLAEKIGDQELLNSDQRTIEALSNRPSVSASGNVTPTTSLLSLPNDVQASIEDIWTWRDPVLATNLGADTAQIKLLALQLREEFMAVRNIELMQSLQLLINDCRRTSQYAHQHSLNASNKNSAATSNSDASSSLAAEVSRMQVEITGPAAVGADLMLAAKYSVQRSELYTVLAVVLTLAVIYRSPLLIFLPLVVIGVALSISTSVLSLLADWSREDGHIKLVELYSTTRVFLVVLIFGIGTDLTLFLIVRCRETFFESKVNQIAWREDVRSSWIYVLGAILGSGLTTAIGLSMMAFSDFAKFRYSGIAIAIAILITLAVCLTLPAAILAGLGPASFWPRRRRIMPAGEVAQLQIDRAKLLWLKIANIILNYPARVLLATCVILLVPAAYGWLKINSVTYNLVGELGSNATSRQGQALVKEYLPRIETSSITLCVVAEQDFDSDAELRQAVETYRKQLFVDGVHSVQALSDPLGEFPPDRTMSLFSQGAWRRRLLQNHPLTQQKFISRVDQYALKAARFEIVTSADPFSAQAATVLGRVRSRAAELSATRESPWYRSMAAFSGTTAGIVDLKRATQADETRVQFLVTISVFLILLLLIRRFELSLYLMFTVLFSFFATLGVTHALFAYLYGGEFDGLDWKVPLFLFVILVAVGQDYNIYLTTRVLEEQRSRGQRAGLRRAIVSTGGIITSCGLIMCATFAAMCIGGLHFGEEALSETGWTIPALRGIAELGFALSFGVLLDTFVIRTILVPAYIAWRKLA